MIATQRPTADQLRADIDNGRTMDKMRGSDPAAAPLGADEEAAGTPLTSQAISMARSYETKHASDEAFPKRGPGAAWILIAIILAIIGLVVFAGVFLTA